MGCASTERASTQPITSDEWWVLSHNSLVNGSWELYNELWEAAPDDRRITFNDDNTISAPSHLDGLPWLLIDAKALSIGEMEFRYDPICDCLYHKFEHEDLTGVGICIFPEGPRWLGRPFP